MNEIYNEQCEDCTMTELGMSCTLPKSKAAWTVSLLLARSTSARCTKQTGDVETLGAQMLRFARLLQQPPIDAFKRYIATEFLGIS